MTAAATQPVTDASFEAEVLNADCPVLVDFWADWCEACPLIAPVLDEIAAEHGDQLRVRKLNIDENPKTAGTYQMLSVPTVGLFYGGQLIRTIVGAQRKSAILEQLVEFIV